MFLNISSSNNKKTVLWKLIWYCLRYWTKLAIFRNAENKRDGNFWRMLHQRELFLDVGSFKHKAKLCYLRNFHSLNFLLRIYCLRNTWWFRDPLSVMFKNLIHYSTPEKIYSIKHFTSFRPKRFTLPRAKRA